MSAWLRRTEAVVPALLQLGKVWAQWLAGGVVMLSGYQLCKLHPFGPPRLLPLTALDRAIPFLPWTVWIYGTVSAATLAAWITVPDRAAARRLFLTLALASCVCWVFFALFPTTYPRELYPLTDGDGATLRELARLRAADDPSNCFPSLHVALASSLALTWRGWLRGWARALPIAWAAAVSLCTLTTKQHYVADVFGGFAVGAAAHVALILAGRGAPAWAPRAQPLSITRDEDKRAVGALLERVRAHQWRLDDLPWPERGEPLDPRMVRLLNHVIYIEEIAGMNFALLERAAQGDDVRELYARFADEERRHADGLRRLLRIHGAALERPGLGNALVLAQFDRLSPASAADAVLVAVSNPVFETFLDAGTIPFLRGHPALRSPAFDRFVELVCRDEAAHMALNWILSRQAARALTPLERARMALNPAIYRGILAIPFMSLDVYAVARTLGYRFATLLPPFGRLWRLHRRYPELSRFPMWWFFRLFVACGAIATTLVIALDRVGLLFIRLWSWVSRVTDVIAWVSFGEGLLARRGLPPVRL